MCGGPDCGGGGDGLARWFASRDIHLAASCSSNFYWTAMNRSQCVHKTCPQVLLVAESLKCLCVCGGGGGGSTSKGVCVVGGGGEYKQRCVCGGEYKQRCGCHEDFVHPQLPLDSNEPVASGPAPRYGLPLLCVATKIVCILRTGVFSVFGGEGRRSERGLTITIKGSVGMYQGNVSILSMFQCCCCWFKSCCCCCCRQCDHPEW
jgi:hypothetical protein